jgi:dihydrolipoamide dehydrogenase
MIYDLVVIGAGPGGYVSAVAAAKRGLKTAIVFHGEMGGNCLHWGCIPTKSLLHDGDGDRKNRVVKRLSMAIEALIKENKIDAYLGWGKIIQKDGNVIKVGVETGEELLPIQTKKVLLATGTKPRIAPFKKSDKVITSDELLQLKNLPQSMAVIGAGAVGLEFAQYLSEMKVKVTVIEMADQILPGEDRDVAELLQKCLERQKIKFILGQKIQNLVEDQKISLTLDSKTIEVDGVLVATGRQFNNADFEKAGIKLGARGEVWVNENFETSLPGVYAVGDMIGKELLAHAAIHQGLCVVRAQNIVPLQNVPACLYTNPEVASVGLHFDKLSDQEKNTVAVSKFMLNHLGKMQAIAENEGFVKLIYEKKSGIILGVSLIGPHVSEMAAYATMLVDKKITVQEVAATIHPHPTVSEGIWEAAMQASGLGIH